MDERYFVDLIYSEEPDGILIVAVAHQKRRPGYWGKRIGSAPRSAQLA